jgi:hypothetical protein
MAPHEARSERHPVRALPIVVIGMVCGLAWSAALRAYMVELAGLESRFDWAGTFAAILLPGAVTGGLLGWAEVPRKRGGTRHWRWLAVGPLCFAIAPLLMPGALVALLTQGLGGGAVAVALFAIVGGYALAGRGPVAARLVCGASATLLVVAITVASPFVGGERLSLTEARGAWVAVLICSLLTVLAIATSIPFRRVTPAAGLRPPVPAQQAGAEDSSGASSP